MTKVQFFVNKKRPESRFRMFCKDKTLSVEKVKEIKVSKICE